MNSKGLLIIPSVYLASDLWITFLRWPCTALLSYPYDPTPKAVYTCRYCKVTRKKPGEPSFPLGSYLPQRTEGAAQVLWESALSQAACLILSTHLFPFLNINLCHLTSLPCKSSCFGFSFLLQHFPHTHSLSSPPPFSHSLSFVIDMPFSHPSQIGIFSLSLITDCLSLSLSLSLSLTKPLPLHWIQDNTIHPYHLRTMVILAGFTSHRWYTSQLVSMMHKWTWHVLAYVEHTNIHIETERCTHTNSACNRASTVRIPFEAQCWHTCSQRAETSKHVYTQAIRGKPSSVRTILPKAICVMYALVWQEIHSQETTGRLIEGHWPAAVDGDCRSILHPKITHAHVHTCIHTSKNAHLCLSCW